MAQDVTKGNRKDEEKTKRDAGLRGSRVEVLASVMGQSPEKIAGRMRLESDAVIINQCDHFSYEELSWQGNCVRFFSCAERGVGRSRNEAILHSRGEICLFSDEDIVYEPGYARAIEEEFERNPGADMILFQIAVAEDRKTYEIRERRRVRWYNCGRYGAVSFAVKREKLLESRVMFSLLYGGGARYSNGEDSLFLLEFIKKGYRVYTAPVLIGREESGSSSWFTGYDRKFFYDRGVLYRDLYGRGASLLALRFLVAHREKMCREVGVRQAFAWMRQGMKKRGA